MKENATRKDVVGYTWILADLFHPNELNPMLFYIMFLNINRDREHNKRLLRKAKEQNG